MSDQCPACGSNGREMRGRVPWSDLICSHEWHYPSQRLPQPDASKVNDEVIRESVAPSDPLKQKAWDIVIEYVSYLANGWDAFPKTKDEFITACEILVPSFVTLRNAYANGDFIEREKVDALIKAASGVTMFPHDGSADDLIERIIRLRAALKEILR